MSEMKESAMLCPRCGVLLNELTKVGVTVDVCDHCRGLWLDRGELEKIVAELRELSGEIGAGARPRREAAPLGDSRYYERRRDDDDDWDERGPRRQGGWRRLLELFD
jgi:Zn-finger nucleic acid-binding protein